jgi:hypothetical protein
MLGGRGLRDKRSVEHNDRLGSRDRGLQRLTSATAVLFVAGLASTGGIAYAASTTHQKAEPDVLAHGSSPGSGDPAERTPATVQPPTADASSAPSLVTPQTVQPNQNSVPQQAVVPAKPAKRHAAVSSGS